MKHPASPGPAPNEEPSLEPKKHDHGQMYRCKIARLSGPPEFSEWFGTESDVRENMRARLRNLGERYYCEMKTITCPECDRGEAPRVISTI